jgi:pseudouridine-5'-phosphate glycosidase
MDIPATLEWLETHRAPVIAYQTEFFPMFYSRSSGCKVEWVVQTAGEVAGYMAAKLALGTDGGILLGVPVPAEHALPEDDTRAAIQTALERIKREKITGKAVTPFLLNVIKDITGSRSLEANVALIRNNAQVGAEVAVALAAMMAPSGRSR